MWGFDDRSLEYLSEIVEQRARKSATYRLGRRGRSAQVRTKELLNLGGTRLG